MPLTFPGPFPHHSSDSKSNSDVPSGPPPPYPVYQPGQREVGQIHNGDRFPSQQQQSLAPPTSNYYAAPSPAANYYSAPPAAASLSPGYFPPSQDEDSMIAFSIQGDKTSPDGLGALVYDSQGSGLFDIQVVSPETPDAAVNVHQGYRGPVIVSLHRGIMREGHSEVGILSNTKDYQRMEWYYHSPQGQQFEYAWIGCDSADGNDELKILPSNETVAKGKCPCDTLKGKILIVDRARAPALPHLVAGYRELLRRQYDHSNATQFHFKCNSDDNGFTVSNVAKVLYNVRMVDINDIKSEIRIHDGASETGPVLATIHNHKITLIGSNSPVIEIRRWSRHNDKMMFSYNNQQYAFKEEGVFDSLMTHPAKVIIARASVPIETMNGDYTIWDPSTAPPHLVIIAAQTELLRTQIKETASAAKWKKANETLEVTNKILSAASGNA